MPATVARSNKIPWLASHPANRLARNLLKSLRAPVHSLPLLDLAATYLHNPENKEQFPHPAFWEDLQTRAAELQKNPQFAASLLVPNHDALDAELGNAKAAGPVLRDHLDGLYRDLFPARRDPQRAGRMLAENLFNSLQRVYPDFGPPNG